MSEDEEDDNLEEEKEDELQDVPEDKIVTSAEFRQWHCLAKATYGALNLICEIVALAASDEDEDFEEMEDD